MVSEGTVLSSGANSHSDTGPSLASYGTRPGRAFASLPATTIVESNFKAKFVYGARRFSKKAYALCLSQGRRSHDSGRIRKPGTLSTPEGFSTREIVALANSMRMAVETLRVPHKRLGVASRSNVLTMEAVKKEASPLPVGASD